MIVLLLSGQIALATPREDATYIVERNLRPEAMDRIRGLLKNQFVGVYFAPLSGRGIQIADHDAFAELIPDEEIAPFVEQILSYNRDVILAIYPPEQIANLAALLRADEDATLHDIVSDEYQQRYEAALAQARALAAPSGSDDPTVIALEELVVQLNAFNASFDSEAFAQSIGASVGFIFAVAALGHEIARLERDFDNPVTLAAIQTDGVLRFANPVQRATLLRQLSPRENTGGIRFVKPPANNTDTE